MFSLLRQRSAFFCGCIFAIILIAGCAYKSSEIKQIDIKNGLWTGRISVHVQSEPEQFFSAGFELRGQPERGELTLISPLGNVLGVLRWSPSEAVFDSGDQKIRRFDSIDALMRQAIGAAVPLDALFAWLRGDNASVSGWSADLSRQSEGRIAAKRMQPAPQVDLRVVLDQ